MFSARETRNGGLPTPSITFEMPPKITQLDGNDSICSNVSSEPELKEKKDQISAATFLPVITTYNLRTLMSKKNSSSQKKNRFYIFTRCLGTK